MKNKGKKGKTCKEKEKENENEKMKNRQEKEGPMGYAPRRPKKMFFYMRAFIGNREAIKANKERILSTRENERK